MSDKLRQLGLVLGLCVGFVSNAAQAEKVAPGVSILYFDYTGQNDQLKVLKKGVAQMLISGLTPVATNCRIVERDRLEEILKELDLGKSGKVDAKTAAKVGKLVGARYIVMGSFFDLFGTLRIDAKMVEVETGVILGSASGQGKLDDFFSVYEGLVGKLGEMLKVKAKPMESEKGKVKKAKRKPRKRAARVPKKLKTATVLEYSKALDAKDRGDKAAAVKHLKAAVKAQPDFEAATLDLNALVQ